MHVQSSAKITNEVERKFLSRQHDVWEPLPNLLFGVLGVISGGLTLLLPETLGQPMFETIQQAEAFNG